MIILFHKPQLSIVAKWLLLRRQKTTSVSNWKHRLASAGTNCKASKYWCQIWTAWCVSDFSFQTLQQPHVWALQRIWSTKCSLHVDLVCVCSKKISQNKRKKQRDVNFKCNHVPKTVKSEPCTYWNVFLVVINLSLINHFCCFAFVFSTWIIIFSFNTMVAIDYNFASAACSLSSRMSLLYVVRQKYKGKPKYKLCGCQTLSCHTFLCSC